MLSPSSPDSQGLAVLLRSVTEAIIVTDVEGTVTYANPAAEKLFSPDGAAGVTGQALRRGAIHPELGNRLNRAITEPASGPLL